MRRRLTDFLMLVQRLTRQRTRAMGALIAMALFTGALVSQFAPIWSEGAPNGILLVDGVESPIALQELSDVKFEAWLVARHARTLSTRPHRLFDTEHCAPFENTLTYGVPMLTMGLLGVPGYLISGDLLFTYNSALVLWVLFAALAMYSLVSEWTGSIAAGIVAALLFAFHPTRLMDVAHPSVVDTTWTVLSLFFAQRLFAHGRWRDAIALGISGGLLIGASFYPFLAAVFLALPYIVWILVRYRFDKIEIFQLVFVTATIGFAAAFVFGPYVEARETSDTLHRSTLYYAPWWGYLRSEWLYPGALVLALAAVGLASPRKRACAGLNGDPRWALAIGALLVAIMAAGPHTNFTFQRIVGPTSLEIPNLYGLLAEVIPGLTAIRGVARLALSVQAVLSVFAGMGAAVLLGLFVRHRVTASAVLVTLALIVSLRPDALGFEQSFRWKTVDVNPGSKEIQFFSDLAALGNQGPILELPIEQGLYQLAVAPDRILLSFYHRRRTSSCFGSYYPDRTELKLVVDDLPAAKAREKLQQMGFTTVIQHHHTPNAIIEPASKYGRLLLSGGEMAAYSLDGLATKNSDPGSN